MNRGTITAFIIILLVLVAFVLLYQRRGITQTPTQTIPTSGVGTSTSPSPTASVSGTISPTGMVSVTSAPSPKTQSTNPSSSTGY